MASALRQVGVSLTYESYAGGHSLGGVSAADRTAIYRAETPWLLRCYSGFR